MSDMPDNIWAIHVHIDNATWYECPVPDTEKYIRADIHEAKIKELEAQLEWQPIETAPKDGTVILCNERGWVYTAFWGMKTPDEYYYNQRSKTPQWLSHNFPQEPTHWMPLPNPPKESE